MSHDQNQKISFLSKKQLGAYLGIKNKASIAKHYRNYLFACGKSDVMLLSNIDVHRIDGVYP